MNSLTRVPDYAALTGAIPRADYQAFRTSAKGRGQEPESTGLGADSSKQGVGIWGGGVLISLVIVVVSSVLAGNSAYEILGVAGLVVFGLVGVFSLAMLVPLAPRFPRRWQLFFRTAKFAEDNGMRLIMQGPLPDYDGLLFHLSSKKAGVNYVLRTKEAPLVEAGQLCRVYDVKGGNATMRRRWGYIVVEVPVNASSRVILRSNTRVSESAVSVSYAQKVGPAIDLDDVFTLYSPADSVATARQVFTPELLSHLHELEKHFSPVNAELHGNRLYVFTLKKLFDFYKPRDVRLVFDTVAAARAASSSTAA